MFAYISWVVGGCWLLFMLATSHQLTTGEGAADGRVNLLGEAIPLESEEDIAEAKKFLGDLHNPVVMLGLCLFSRWWFQTFFIFTPNWGRFPIWLIFFQMGWNHQPVLVSVSKLFQVTMTSVTSLLLFASCDPMTRKMLWKLKHILTLRNPRISEALPGETPQGSLELSADLQNVTLNLSRRWVTLVQVACLWQFFAIIVPVFPIFFLSSKVFGTCESYLKHLAQKIGDWGILGGVWRFHLVSYGGKELLEQIGGVMWIFFVRNTSSWDDLRYYLPRGKRYDFYSLFLRKIIVEDDIHPNFRWSWSALWVALPGRVPSLRRLTLKQLQIPLPVSVLQLLGAVWVWWGASWRTCWKYYHSW